MKHLPLYLIAAVLPWSLGAEQNEFKVVGSDLLQHALEKPFMEYAEGQEEWSVSLDLFGSIPALNQLEAGDADLAVVAIPDDSTKPSSEYQMVPFAFQVAMVVVNEVNPMEELNFSQLEGIYGINSEVNYARWNEIGLTGVWSNRPIQAMALNKNESVVFELFKYKALNRSPLKATVILATTEREIYDAMSSDAGTIAVVDRAPTGDGFKVLAISSGAQGEFGFGPTPENVFYGDYSMRLPIYLVFKEENKQKIKEILHFLLSKSLAETIGKKGFMPLPENVRRRTILELDIEP